MDPSPGPCLVEALAMVVFVEVESALGMAVQFPAEFYLSVLFASMNCRGYSCFNQGFSADYRKFGFFVNDVF